MSIDLLGFMKRMIPLAAGAAFALTSAGASVRVAYPVPGHSGLLPDSDRQRIIIGNFLDDFFRHAPNHFTRISDPIKRTVLAQVNSGAWAFDTDDKRINFSRWKKIDLFVDFNLIPTGKTPSGYAVGPVKVDFFYEGANESKTFEMESIGEACEWLAEKILAACSVPKAETAALRKFVADRRAFLVDYYLAPGIVGHYTDSGVEPRLEKAQTCYKKSRNNPLVLTRIVDAAYLAVTDKRKMSHLTPAKVKAIGLNALESLVGKVDPLDEEILKPFIYHYRDEVRAILSRLDKGASAKTLDDLEDDALGGESDEPVDDDLSLDKTRTAGELAAVKACVRRFRDWCEHGYEVPPPVPGEADEVANIVTGGGKHPLLVRHGLMKAAKKKDAAALVEHLGDSFRPSRALALTLLAELDPEKAYPHLLTAMGDVHTWLRFHAAMQLAKLAKAADAKAIAGFLAKERNRATRLYLEDALAKAEGRPQPPPRPAAHPIPKDRTLIWGGGGSLADVAPWDATYTCALPELEPSEVNRRAYDRGKYVISRPTPVGDGGWVVSDPACADTFWTTLDRQAPDLTLRYNDGFVFGEESMGMDPWANWKTAWTVFCEEAGIDPKRIGGDRAKLTEEERVRYLDWGKSVCIEGFNVLYDFTKAYFGKLKPGFTVCTATCHESGTGGAHAADWRFDLSMGYIYGVGPTTAPRWRNRRAYALVRLYRTLWPERPCQWGSWGMPRHLEVERQLAEAAAEDRAKGRTPRFIPEYRQIWEQEPMFPRFDECYSATITSYQAGGMPGWFTAFSTHAKTGKDGCVWMDGGIYPGAPSPTLDEAVRYAFQDTLVDYRDAMKAKDSPALDDGGEDDVIDLEEEGGKDDPAFKRQQDDMRKFRIGYLNAYRYVYDTARTQAGLPRYDPEDFASLILATGRGRYQESSAAQWMNGFDYADDASQVVQRGLLKKYRFIAVSDADGKGTAMDEMTKRDYLKWLKQTPGVLWVEGVLADNPRRTFDHPNGDLVSKWPWDVASVTNRTEELFVWKNPAWKAIVIFEKPAKKAAAAAVESGGRIVKEFFAANGVEMDWPVAPGVIVTKIGGLEIWSLSQRSTYTGRVKGVEILTGERDPVITPEGENGFAMVATGDYTAPWVAVRNGIRVLAGNRFEKVESVPGGLRVTQREGPLGEPSALPSKEVERSGSSGRSFTFTRK